MKIFNYSPITGEFLTESLADESPLEKGVFLIPAFATAIQPTETKENQVSCFNDDSQQWEVKPDYRGKTYYDKSNGNPVVIDFIGGIPDTLQETPLPPPEPPQPTEIELKVQIIESRWKLNPEALQDYYDKPYQKIKAFLLENKIDDAVKYLTDLQAVVPENLLPILNTFLTEIQESFQW